MRGHFTKRLVIYLSAILLTFCAGVLSAQLLTGKQPSVSQAEAEAAAAPGHCFPASVSPPVDPKNVIDYYRLLPDKYFEANEEQRVNWMLDERRGAIVDLEHGYLHALGDGAQNGYLRASV